MSQFTPNTEGIFLGLSRQEYEMAPGIRQSLLKKFASEPTPRHFKESLTRPAKETEAMEFGTVLHAAILTPELLSQSYHLKPQDYPGPKGPKPWHGGADWCKDWIKDHGDRPILDLEQELNIMSIVSTVLYLPVAGDIIHSGQREVSFLRRMKRPGCC